MKESKIQVTVQEFMANVECQLTYVNEGPDPLQTSFVFPMDDMSAVYKFEAHVNKKHIIAECQDKKKVHCLLISYYINCFFACLIVNNIFI